MKLAFVTPEFVTEPDTADGGLANYLDKTARFLVSKGHEVHVYVASNLDNSDLVYEGVKVHRAYINYGSWRLWLWQLYHLFQQDSTMRWLYISYLLKNRIQASNQTYDLIQYSSYGAGAHFRISGTPCVVRVSSYEPAMQIARGEQPTQDNRATTKLELESILKADAVYAPSKLTAGLVSKAIGIEVQQIYTMFEPRAGIKYDNHLSQIPFSEYILYFGTISRLKGAGLIADVIYEVLQQHPNLGMVLVGKEHPGTVVQIKAAAKEFNQRVLWLPSLPHNQLYPIIDKAKLVLMPSLYDNLPNTLIEACSLGKVVLGAEGASYEEILTDGVTGFLFKLGDSEQMLLKINHILGLPASELAKIGHAAKASLDKLAPAKIGEQLLQYFTQVIDKFAK